MGDWIWRQTPNKKFLTNRFKPNLSLLSTESTIDSDNFTLNNEHNNNEHNNNEHNNNEHNNNEHNNNEHNNNSFTTHFSGHSTSFNNSGKIDFNTPSRLDSSKLNPEVIYLIKYIASDIYILGG